MPQPDFAFFVESSARRLREARVIADGLRHSNAMHRLAMTAVFVLEDCHEAFQRIFDDSHPPAPAEHSEIG